MGAILIHYSNHDVMTVDTLCVLYYSHDVKTVHTLCVLYYSHDVMAVYIASVTSYTLCVCVCVVYRYHCGHILKAHNYTHMHIKYYNIHCAIYLPRAYNMIEFLYTLDAVILYYLLFNSYS